MTEPLVSIDYELKVFFDAANRRWVPFGSKKTSECNHHAYAGPNPELRDADVCVFCWHMITARAVTAPRLSTYARLGPLPTPRVQQAKPILQKPRRGGTGYGGRRCRAAGNPGSAKAAFFRDWRNQSEVWKIFNPADGA